MRRLFASMITSSYNSHSSAKVPGLLVLGLLPNSCLGLTIHSVLTVTPALASALQRIPFGILRHVTGQLLSLVRPGASMSLSLEENVLTLLFGVPKNGSLLTSSTLGVVSLKLIITSL